MGPQRHNPQIHLKNKDWMTNLKTTYQKDKRTTHSPLMSKQQAPGASRTEPTDEANAIKPINKSTRKTTPRHSMDKPKEELYAAKKEANTKESREHVIKTLHGNIYMENLEENIEDLKTLS